MLLERLVDYALTLDATPLRYVPASLGYFIELDALGNLLVDDLIDLAEPGSKRAGRGRPWLLPQVQRSGKNAPPFLLADNAQYVLGLPKKATDGTKAERCHERFIECVEKCADETGSADVRAVARLLRSEAYENLKRRTQPDPIRWITFRVDGRVLVDDLVVQGYWAAMTGLDPTAPVRQCLICHRMKPVLRRSQLLIKGVPGGQLAGVAMISANAAGAPSPNAFESYGLEVESQDVV